MKLNEMVTMFLASRRLGVDGARKKCSPKTIKIYQDNLRLFTTYLATGFDGSTILEYTSIKKIHMVSFYEWMDAKISAGKWSKATVLQILRSLKAFFRWVERDEDCKELKMVGIQRWLPTIGETPKRTDMPVAADIKRFKNSFKTDNPWQLRDYIATCLMLTNGIRIGELCNLTIENTRLEDQTLIVTGKTGTRLVPITGEMAKLLKVWLRRRKLCTHAGSPYVFISKRGEKMNPVAFDHAFSRHRKKHQLPRISPHSFRHAFCTNYLKNGGDMEKLRNITGHASYDMLLAYLHLAKVGGKEAHAELEKVNMLKEV